MWAASFPVSGRRCSCSASPSRSGCTSSTRPSRRRRAAPSRRASPATRHYDTARATLARLPVKGWDRNTDFSRYRFGEAWSDDVNVEFGHNGCNTRDDILRRDLADLVVRPGTCYAQSGVLHDPYTGQTIEFIRGPTPRRRCRSTIWCRCPTPGTRAPASGTTSAAATSPTTRATCWPSARKPTSTRLFATPPRGCRPTRRSAASSSRGRSTSRPPTGCGCPRTRSGRWQTVLARC